MRHLTIQQLSASLDGALTGPSLELVARHLAGCHACRDRQARLTKHDDALRRLLAQDPGDEFLDDLTRRAEALVVAISRGMPAPVMVTSVPLLHEEDPYAPVEPPPLPPRPELGRSAEIAQEAGWGRIGLKPTAPAQAPASDPAEVQRLLDALASGNTDDFTELTAQGLREHAQIDGPVFDLPAWIKEQSRQPEAITDAPREVPKLNLFFDQLDEHAASMTREAVDEVFRRDDVPAHEPEEETVATPERIPQEYQARGSVPPEHAAYAPAAGTPMEPNEAAWGRAGVAPAPPDPGAQSPPPQAGAHRYRTGDAPALPRGGRPVRRDRSLLMALLSVGGLVLIVLVLQLMPPAPVRKASDDTVTFLGVRLPRVQLVRHNSSDAPPEPSRPAVRTAATQPPPEQLVPPSRTTGAVEPAPSVEARTPELSRIESTPAPPPAPVRDVPAARTEPESARPPEAPARETVAPPVTTRDDANWPLVCGQVEDAAGRPVVGARVTLAELSFAIRTDARGRFCLSAPPGVHQLLVEASGFQSQREPASFSTTTPDLRIRLLVAR